MSLSEFIPSPLVPEARASKVKDFSVGLIVDSYRRSFDIDVTSFFGDRRTIDAYCCPVTELVFFAPSTLAGDGAFYEQLQRFPWYYMPWKWEHGVVLDSLPRASRVLEIGCGEGAFLRRVNEAGAFGVGLELNRAACVKAQGDSLNVFHETVQDHAIRHSAAYDVVCSFQVMEHVVDLRNVLDASIETLKPGGKLVVSVPNNRSFLRYADDVLNLPPHHMNHWDEVSLAKLSDVFPIVLQDIRFEPLQDYHYLCVMNATIDSCLPSKRLRGIAKRAAKAVGLHSFVGFWKDRIPGHTVTAFYSKKV